jgi:prepilin-type N-terminal cleavage/methylation domain-containing protein
MNWSFGLDLDDLKSQNGFLMIEVIIASMIISVMVLLLYQTILTLLK